MSDDGLAHLSKKTRERAYVLSRNARQLGIPVGHARFTPSHDYMSYYLTAPATESWAVIFCCPDGYLVSLWTEDEEDGISSSYLAVRNIRHLLQHLKKAGYCDVDVAFPSLGGDEVDLRSYLEDLE